MPSVDAGGQVVTKGVCHVLFAYDVGLSIDLSDAERRITATKERGTFRHKQRAPDYLEYRPAPLRIIHEAAPLKLGDYTTAPPVEVVLYDFGAVSVSYKIPVQGPLAGLLDLSEILYGNPELLADSRQRIEGLLLTITPAIERPTIATEVEDYLIFEIADGVAEAWPAGPSGHVTLFANILRCERSALSDQEITDATSHRISFGRDDLAVIDWNAAILFGLHMEDVLAVLEFANVELLEMRVLDGQLDAALDQAHEALSRRRGPFWTQFGIPGSLEADSTRIARMQVDSAILFERVNNTLKLVGDQYLARVYRLVSQRFHLETWDGSITRKLHTLDSIYGKLSDRAATRRMEALEWIIIVLIALSIAVSFHP